MAEKPDKDRFLKEYHEFMSLPGEAPPPAFAERVRSAIQAKLNPSLLVVLTKTTGLYMIAGLFILLICPQFGLTLAARHGVLHIFSLFGHYPCMALCGALFLGSGTIVTSLVLLPEELRKLRPLRFVYFVVFGLVALATFWILGAEIALGLAVAWLIGSLVGEGIAFEVGCRVRFGMNW